MFKKLTSLFVITIMILTSFAVIPSVHASGVDIQPVADGFVTGGDWAAYAYDTKPYVEVMIPKKGYSQGLSGSAHGLMEFDLTSADLSGGKVVNSAVLNFGYTAYDTRMIDIYRIEESIAGKHISWNDEEFSKYWKAENGYVPSDGTKKASVNLTYTANTGSVDLTDLIEPGDTKLTIMIAARESDDWYQRLRFTSLENDGTGTPYAVHDALDTPHPNYGQVPTLTVKTGKPISTPSMPDNEQAIIKNDGSVLVPVLSTSYGGLNTSLGYVLFKLDLSGVTGPIDKCTFKYNVGTGSTLTRDIYAVYDLNENWVSDSGNTNSLAGIDNYNIVNSACSDPENKIATSYGVIVEKPVTIDVTKAARKAQYMGKDKLTLAFEYTPGTAYNIYTNVTARKYPSYNYDLITTVEYNATPDISVVSSASAPGGGCDVSLKLNTYIDDTNLSYVELREKQTKTSVSNADVSFDSGEMVLNIKNTQPLEPDTDYEIVFKSGMSDMFGNSLTADKEGVYTFTTPLPLVIKPVLYYSGIESVYGRGTEAYNYAPGEQITAITEITNNSANPQKAILIIAQYDENNTLLGVDIDNNGGTPIPGNGATVTFSKEFTAVESTGGRIITYIWDSPSTIRPLLTPPAELQQRR